MTWEIRVGDCRETMAGMTDESIDSIVTDPPYGLSKEPDMMEVLRHWMAGDDYSHKSKGFMGKSWDSFVPGPAVWKEAYRVLKPGGHLVAFFGTRTYDMGVLAIRLAGFEIRDQSAWLFGSGFPKSHNVAAGIDKKLGAERAIISERINKSSFDSDGEGGGGFQRGTIIETEPTTKEAKQWRGWGSALKPAFEPIVIARKPLSGTIAENVLKHGVGGLNIDGCRVGTDGGTTRSAQTEYAESGWRTGHEVESLDAGRWPANVIHDGSDEVLAEFPEADAAKSGGRSTGRNFGQESGDAFAKDRERTGHDDAGGSVARFFYAAKASVLDRNEGLDDFTDKASASAEFRPNHAEKAALGEDGNPYGRWQPRKNIHPTVKPTDLMRYLCRLVTPPGGMILDPFAGSGSTGKGAVVEGFNFIGCELSEEYAEIARARIAYAERFKNSPELLGKTASKPKKYDFNLFE